MNHRRLSQVIDDPLRTHCDWRRIVWPQRNLHLRSYNSLSTSSTCALNLAIDFS